MPPIKITEVVLVLSNLANNTHQQDSSVKIQDFTHIYSK